MIDELGLRKRLDVLPKKERLSLSYRINFLKDLKTRVDLNTIGTRCFVVQGDRIFVAGYFSDNLTRYDINDFFKISWC